MIKIFDRFFVKSASPKGPRDSGPQNLEDAYAIIMRHVTAPPLRIDTHVDPDTFQRLLKRVETTWARLGQEDAHWSVTPCVSVVVRRSVFPLFLRRAG